MKRHIDPDAIVRFRSFDSFIAFMDETEPERDFLVAEDGNGKITGWTGLVKRTRNDRWGIVTCVTPEHVSSDLPAELLDSILELAAKRGITALRASVQAPFSSLRDALERRGFRSESGLHVLLLEEPGTVTCPNLPDGITLATSEVNDDYRALAETLNAAFSGDRDWKPVTGSELEGWDRFFLERGDEFTRFYANDGEQQAGYSQATVMKTGRGEKKGLVSGLGVRPGYQRRGTGKALLRQAINWLAGKGCSKIMIEVKTYNERALAIYRNQGFMEWKERTVMNYTLRRKEK